MGRRLAIAAAAWALLAGLAQGLSACWGCGWDALPQRVAELPALGATALFLVLYVLRPVLLVPAPVVCMAAGAAFGPGPAFAITWLGENLGAQLAFGLARLAGVGDAAARRLSPRWRGTLADRGTSTVVLLRLSFIPHDAINYGCGLSPIAFRDFALGTAVGILPGVALFSFAGSSLAGHDSAWIATSFAGLSLAGALLLARSLRRSHAAIPSATAEPS